MSSPWIGIGADLSKGPCGRDRAFSFMTYVDAIRRAGAIPVVLPPQPENAHEVVHGLDGLLLAGGFDCDPAIYGREAHPSVERMDVRRQENDLALAKAARTANVPTLGICLGLQVMNVAAGGTLLQDIPSEVTTEITHTSLPGDRASHEVEIEPESRLGNILSGRQYTVNSSHHQAVDTPGEGLDITARAPDGVVEAIEDAGHPFYIGVQWHPEDMATSDSAAVLFRAFLDAASAHASRRGDSVPAATPRS